MRHWLIVTIKYTELFKKIFLGKKSWEYCVSIKSTKKNLYKIFS
jgi:hypothetical protein